MTSLRSAYEFRLADNTRYVKAMPSGMRTKYSVQIVFSIMTPAFLGRLIYFYTNGQETGMNTLQHTY